MRWLAVSLLALFVTLLPLATNETAQAQSWTEADAAAKLQVLKQAVADPNFAKLNPALQYVIWQLLAASALDTDDFPTASTAQRNVTSSPFANWRDWCARYSTALAMEDRKDAIASLASIAEKWPDKINLFEYRSIQQLVSGEIMANGAEAATYRLLQALYAMHWKADDKRALPVDWLWMELVRHELELHDVRQAKAVAARIANPRVMRRMRTERVFDPVTEADPVHFDVDRANRAWLALTLEWVADEPDRLEPIHEAASQLYALDYYGDALVLLDRALARANDKGATPFRDQADNLNWIYDTRSNVLAALGRGDEALAILEAAAREGELRGEVSQTINLANYYVELGRAHDALAALKRIDMNTASPFGRMQYQGVRLHAFVVLNNRKGIDEALAYINQHAGDAVEVKMEALLLTGDLDTAARIVIAQLADPVHRSDTIDALQGHAETNVRKDATPQQKIDAAMEALRNRDDVRTALAPYGRIL